MVLEGVVDRVWASSDSISIPGQRWNQKTPAETLVISFLHDLLLPNQLRHQLFYLFSALQPQLYSCALLPFSFRVTSSHCDLLRV